MMHGTMSLKSVILSSYVKDTNVKDIRHVGHHVYISFSSANPQDCSSA